MSRTRGLGRQRARPLRRVTAVPPAMPTPTPAEVAALDPAAPFPFMPALPIGSIGLRASGLWGVVFLVISEASIFAYVLFAYFYFAVQPHSGPWPPNGPPEVSYAVAQTLAALAGCGALRWACRAAAAGARVGLLSGLSAGLVLSLIFVALQLLDWNAKPFSLATDPYSSLYFTIGGIHLAHVVAGVVMLAAVLLWSALGYFGRVRHVPVTVAAFYWYFVTIVWLAIAFALYVTPYLE
ncbi:MAG: heme-copper oxidase subunit III [Alphaproteobacteria bacterium]|nr:heme-copper oxidase subunit III [Alphaproteobacteria bacterium]